MGIGTITPAEELHIAGTAFPGIRLEDDGASPQSWEMLSSSNNFVILDITAGTNPFEIEDGAANSTLVVADTSRVGIGTSAPTSTLEVTKSDGTSQILVDENSGTAANRTLLALENNGKPQMVFTNSASGRTWKTGMTGADHFQIKTGNKRLQIFKNGRVKVIRGGTTTLDLQTNGDLTIAGTYFSSSDVDAKADLAPVDGREVLAQLAALPVATWRYKDDEDEARHLGPSAQDFRAAFGLGEDDKHIAPADMAGVALAAIQALQAQNLALQARVAALEERLARAN